MNTTDATPAADRGSGLTDQLGHLPHPLRTLPPSDIAAIRAYAAAQVAAERERCAKLCEAEHVGRDMYDEELDDPDLAYNNAVRDCAAAIRRA